MPRCKLAGSFLEDQMAVTLQNSAGTKTAEASSIEAIDRLTSAVRAGQDEHKKMYDEVSSTLEAARDKSNADNKELQTELGKSFSLADKNHKELQAANERLAELEMKHEALMEFTSGKTTRETELSQEEIDSYKDVMSGELGAPHQDDNTLMLAGEKHKIDSDFVKWHNAGFWAAVRSHDKHLPDMNIVAKKYGLKKASALNIVQAPQGGIVVPPPMSNAIMGISQKYTSGSLANLATVVQVVGPSFSLLAEYGKLEAYWNHELAYTGTTTLPTLYPKTIPVAVLSLKVGLSLERIRYVSNSQAYLIEKARNIYMETESKAHLLGAGGGAVNGILESARKVVTISALNKDEQPLGTIKTIKTGSATGFGTTNVANDNYGVNSLIFGINNLHSMFSRNASITMNRMTKALLAVTRDSDGVYLLRMNRDPNSVAPDQFMGVMIHINDHMPDIADGADPVLIGDLRAAYIIGRQGGMTISQDDISAADSGQRIYRFNSYQGAATKDTQALRLLRTAA